jgi:hypothetical protein
MGNDTTEYRVEYPGVDVVPALISLNPECVVDAAGGPVSYRSLTVDALCLAGSEASYPGLASLRLLIYGIIKVGVKAYANPKSLEAGPQERTLLDFPLTGYTAFSSYMAPEGFSFERADGTRYFGTYEFVAGAPDAELPPELNCQSTWTKAKGVSEFTLELSKCTTLFQLGSLKVLAIIDLTHTTDKEALRAAFRAFLDHIVAKSP